MVFGPTQFFAKGAILLLYLRLFTISPRMRYSIWLGLILDFLLYWSGVPITTYYCTPRIGKPWNAFVIDQNCLKFGIYTVVQGAFSVILDLYIFILPIPVVLKIQMAPKRRVSILGIFGTACLWVLCNAFVKQQKVTEIQRNYRGGRSAGIQN